MGVSESDRSSSAGSAPEFIRLLGLNERLLNGYILSLVPNWADADEIAQETKLRLWEQFQTYDPSRDFGAWARTIAHFQVLTYRKKAGRERARFSGEFVALVDQEAARYQGELESRRSAMGRCLKKLDPERSALLRRYYGGPRTLREIAGDIGRSAAWVEKEMQRIRNLLALCIRKALGAEGDA